MAGFVFVEKPTMSVLREVGIFWDIENIPIPKNADVRAMISELRNAFVPPATCRERSFTIVGNLTLMAVRVRATLNSLQVTLMHVEQTRKNAADLKLSELMKSFIEDVGRMSADRHVMPRVVLISSDYHFKDDLYTLKLKRGCETILIHHPKIQNEMLDFCSQAYPYTSFFGKALSGGGTQSMTEPEGSVDEAGRTRFWYKFVLRVSGYNDLPRQTLSGMLAPFGGKVLSHNPTGYAKVGFRNKEESDLAKSKIQMKLFNGERLTAEYKACDNPWMQSESPPSSEQNSGSGFRGTRFNTPNERGNRPPPSQARVQVYHQKPVASVVLNANSSKMRSKKSDKELMASPFR
ncbi:unnamed protein product [Notodromas monacha]|uniref:NYN domain-containing protein n=1 Tax=Notodromas monacha TaxID=399045 RepID=A0A7R9G8A4_9CRUS|nr:unnamed protein product [Notodromas monacha]CAG0912938.1 unnamed protein product [Notodromas monacha]